MKTNLPVKNDSDDNALEELEKKEKLRQIEESINQKDSTLVKVIRRLFK